MQFMSFRPLIFPFQPKNETVSQSVTAWKAGKALVWTKTWSNRVGALKCFPFPSVTPHSSSTFISSTTEIVSAIRMIIFFCSMRKYLCVGLFIHSYGSGLLLWMMRPRCHRKWRWVFSEKVEFSPKKIGRKQNRSPNRSLSSFFKKLFQVEGNGAKGNTLRRWPWPRLLFVPAFKLYAR